LLVAGLRQFDRSLFCCWLLARLGLGERIAVAVAAAAASAAALVLYFATACIRVCRVASTGHESLQVVARTDGSE